MVANCIVLFENLLKARFKTSTEEDRKILADQTISMRKRFAIMHRLDCKTILESNINICNILARILANI